MAFCGDDHQQPLEIVEGFGVVPELVRDQPQSYCPTALLQHHRLSELSKQDSLRNKLKTY